MKTICDSVNHTRFLKEDHEPDWACRDKHCSKGDHVEYHLPFIHLYPQTYNSLPYIIDHFFIPWSLYPQNGGNRLL